MNAAPLVTLPRLTVRADGAALSPELTQALGSVAVRQRLGLPTRCELLFFGPDPGGASSLPLPPGTHLEVGVEERGGPLPGSSLFAGSLFDGEVTAVEVSCGGDAGVEIAVRAYDRLHRLRKRRSVRAHVDVTPAGLARELTADLGLTVEAEEEGPTRRWLLQDGGSDLDLLTGTAAAAGLYPVLRGETLYLITLAGIEAGAVPLTLGDSLLEAHFEASGEPCCRGVEATGWDPSHTVLTTGRATRPRSGRRVAAAVEPGAVGGDENLVLAGARATTDREAEALAQAELDRRSAGEVVLRGIALGDPRLAPGVAIELAGVPRPFAGRHVLTEVEHTINGEVGYVAELSTAPPPPPSALASPPLPIASWGTVTRIDDPEDLGRVKVALPTFSEVESDWLPVLAAGAGAGKGILALPDVGDQVLLLFPHGDPAGGIVLGGLYGVDPPPDAGVEAGARRRFNFLTPGGQRLRLDDGAKSVRLENSEGSYLELTPETVHLSAAADLTLEAPEHSITVRAARIDFQRG